MALGIVNIGVRNDCEPAFALLSDYVLKDSLTLRIGSVLGIHRLLENMRIFYLARLVLTYKSISRLRFGLCWYSTRRCNVSLITGNVRQKIHLRDRSPGGHLVRYDKRWFG